MAVFGDEAQVPSEHWSMVKGTRKNTAEAPHVSATGWSGGIPKGLMKEYFVFCVARVQNQTKEMDIIRNSAGNITDA